MIECWGVSIFVVNYNNAQFLAAAIDSALAQDHPLCEVIVVDDCSSDDSRAIISRYGGRIRYFLRDTNGGQVVAQDSAWSLARYPILIFLDSDDLLLPKAAATVAGLWTVETVKIQFPLATIDKTGLQLGHVAPKYPPNLDTATLRAELLRTGGSPNSPGSGNAYSRALLERLSSDGAFDLENPRDYHMDAVLECNSPFYGEVITLYEPLASYRIHDSNIYAMNAVENARFAMKCRTFELKVDYLARRCRQWGVAFDATAARNGGGRTDCCHPLPCNQGLYWRAPAGGKSHFSDCVVHEYSRHPATCRAMANRVPFCPQPQAGVVRATVDESARRTRSDPRPSSPPADREPSRIEWHQAIWRPTSSGVITARSKQPLRSQSCVGSNSDTYLYCRSKLVSIGPRTAPATRSGKPDTAAPKQTVAARSCSECQTRTTMRLSCPHRETRRFLPNLR
jgi:hypothetical protein